MKMIGSLRPQLLFKSSSKSNKFTFSQSVPELFWGGLADITAMENGEAPLIIFHGTLDPVVPFALAEQLEARARAVSVPFEFHPLVGAGHAAWEFMEQFIAWITPFLYQHLIGEF